VACETQTKYTALTRNGREITAVRYNYRKLWEATAKAFETNAPQFGFVKIATIK